MFNKLIELECLAKIADDVEREVVTEEIKRELAGVAKWHKKTFKDATMGGQLLKLEEEYKELVEAIDKGNNKEIYQEMADVLIVSAGLIRLNSLIGSFHIEINLEKMDIKELINTLKAIREKMKINRARKWDKLKDGRFKHK